MFLKRGFVVITDLLNSSAAGSGESQSATPAPTLAPAQIIQIDELCRDVALADIVEHESAIGCLAGTRSWLKHPNFPLIIDAWNVGYVQIRTQKNGLAGSDGENGDT